MNITYLINSKHLIANTILRKKYKIFSHKNKDLCHPKNGIEVPELHEMIKKLID